MGNYRIRYEINDTELVVKLLQCKHRRDVYRWGLMTSHGEGGESDRKLLHDYGEVERTDALP